MNISYNYILPFLVKIWNKFIVYSKNENNLVPNYESLFVYLTGCMRQAMCVAIHISAAGHDRVTLYLYCFLGFISLVILFSTT